MWRPTRNRRSGHRAGGRAVSAAGEQHRPAAEHQRAAAANRYRWPARRACPLGAEEPHPAGERQDARDEEVESQAEDVVGRVDAQQLLEDPERRVSRDVEGEQARRPHPAPTAKHDQHGGQCQVEGQLVEERGVERGVPLIPRRAVSRINLERPRQLRGAAEQLLVEIVADPADRLCDQQSGRGSIHERRDVHASAAQAPQPHSRTGSDPAPDPQAALPDRQRPPPVVRHLVPARREVVQATPNQTRREAHIATSCTSSPLPPCRSHRRRVTSIAALTPSTYIRP